MREQSGNTASDIQMGTETLKHYKKAKGQNQRCSLSFARSLTFNRSTVCLYANLDLSRPPWKSLTVINRSRSPLCGTSTEIRSSGNQISFHHRVHAVSCLSVSQLNTAHVQRDWSKEIARCAVPVGNTILLRPPPPVVSFPDAGYGAKLRNGHAHMRSTDCIY
jgi:hypothetical protein